MRLVPSWDQYFMEMAKTAAIRSKDPATQVGAILVDYVNHIKGTGYNGFKPGSIETPELWERPTKYEHVRHAERNCIEHSSDLVPYIHYKLYTTMFPCLDCIHLICSKPIKDIYYLDDKYYSDEGMKLLHENGVRVTKL